MAKRQVFFSFEYGKDAWRASQVRNMGKVSDSSTFSDNDWEEVKNKSDKEIKSSPESPRQHQGLRPGLMTRWLKDPVLSF